MPLSRFNLPSRLAFLDGISTIGGRTVITSRGGDFVAEGAYTEFRRSARDRWTKLEPFAITANLEKGPQTGLSPVSVEEDLERLRKKEGIAWRLPTEEEWELFIRGGPHNVGYWMTQRYGSLWRTTYQNYRMSSQDDDPLLTRRERDRLKAQRDQIKTKIDPIENDLRNNWLNLFDDSELKNKLGLFLCPEIPKNPPTPLRGFSDETLILLTKIANGEASISSALKDELFGYRYLRACNRASQLEDIQGTSLDDPALSILSPLSITPDVLEFVEGVPKFEGLSPSAHKKIMRGIMEKGGLLTYERELVEPETLLDRLGSYRLAVTLPKEKKTPPRRKIVKPDPLKFAEGRPAGLLAQLFIKGPKGFVPAVAEIIDRPMTPQQHHQTVSDLREVTADFDYHFHIALRLAGKKKDIRYRNHLLHRIVYVLRKVALQRVDLSQPKLEPDDSSPAVAILVLDAILREYQKEGLFRKKYVSNFARKMRLGALKVYPDVELDPDPGKELTEDQIVISLRQLLFDYGSVEESRYLRGSLFSLAEMAPVEVLRRRGRRAYPILRRAIVHPAVPKRTRLLVADALSRPPFAQKKDIPLIQSVLKSVGSEMEDGKENIWRLTEIDTETLDEMDEYWTPPPDWGWGSDEDGEYSDDETFRDFRGRFWRF